MNRELKRRLDQMDTRLSLLTDHDQLKKDMFEIRDMVHALADHLGVKFEKKSICLITKEK